ncbi:MAG: UDP-2,3-diacylglucosamine diphosphatase LpxI [Candidatus Omnitrophota bacterium]|jgi:hypothetical protein
MKIGIIAGNRSLPVILSKAIKEKYQKSEVVAICFRNETSPHIKRYADTTYWLRIGDLAGMKHIIRKEKLKECIMSGQISPVRIFDRRNWDKELIDLVARTKDMRPHSIFSAIIAYLESFGLHFLDSTFYLKESLSCTGVMNGLSLSEIVEEDVEFGTKMASRFVDLDIGQTILVKNKSVVALEALEGTDNTIKRGYGLAGKGCVVLKFSKLNQDLRFDVPVVGISTLKLLRKIRACALVLETGKTLILEKEEFLKMANRYSILVIGVNKL